MRGGNDSFVLEYSGSRPYEGGRPEFSLKNSWTVNGEETEGRSFHVVGVVSMKFEDLLEAEVKKLGEVN